MSTARRSVEEVLSQADELTAWFENVDRSELEEAPVAECLLKRAARNRALCEREIADAVERARADGATWHRIGEILGVDEQEARETYGSGEAQRTEADPIVRRSP